jgi:hypothetical protein
MGLLPGYFGVHSGCGFGTIIRETDAEGDRIHKRVGGDTGGVAGD